MAAMTRRQRVSFPSLGRDPRHPAKHEYMALAIRVAELIDLAHLRSRNQLGSWAEERCGERWIRRGCCRTSALPRSGGCRDRTRFTRTHASPPVGRADEGARDLVGEIRVRRVLFAAAWRGGAREHLAYLRITSAAEKLAPALDQATKQSREPPSAGGANLGRRVTEDRGDDGPSFSQAVTVHEQANAVLPEPADRAGLLVPPDQSRGVNCLLRQGFPVRLVDTCETN